MTKIEQLHKFWERLWWIFVIYISNSQNIIIIWIEEIRQQKIHYQLHGFLFAQMLGQVLSGLGSE